MGYLGLSGNWFHAHLCHSGWINPAGLQPNLFSLPDKSQARHIYTTDLGSSSSKGSFALVFSKCDQTSGPSFKNVFCKWWKNMSCQQSASKPISVREYRNRNNYTTCRDFSVASKGIPVLQPRSLLPAIIFCLPELGTAQRILRPRNPLLAPRNETMGETSDLLVFTGWNSSKTRVS